MHDTFVSLEPRAANTGLTHQAQEKATSQESWAQPGIWVKLSLNLAFGLSYHFHGYIYLGCHKSFGLLASKPASVPQPEEPSGSILHW